jgi:hypothetical protein
MFKAKKESGWKFATSSGGSLGFPVFGPVGGTLGKGTLVFTSPDGATVEFQYISAGASVGKGLPVSLAGSTRDFPSSGTIYVSSTFSGADLSIQDIKGYALIQELAYGGGGPGYTGTVMLLGIPAKHMPMEIVNNTGALGIAGQLAVDHPDLTRLVAGPLGWILFDEAKDSLAEILQDDAKAAVIMRGANVGLQVQAGASQSIGYIWGGTVSR